MPIIYRQGDLFEYIQTRPRTHVKYFAHCVSTDDEQTKGFALRTVKEYPWTRVPFAYAHPRIVHFLNYQDIGCFKLVTKVNYWEQPERFDFDATIIALHTSCLKQQLIDPSFDTLHIPRIGSGLDKLDWASTHRILEDVFHYTGITIVVHSKTRANFSQ